ncbi:hypothetical protein PHMEG_00022498 [Phytophthora megakarya]|uniref:Uncharacterized protein n=1 Tax=Phytophthora megakarya TaxID=4795 RepID=A0A225VK79_9STRA|nr:hypothetical protein PHMEG_00022498 [Phytophthora megakarya]
MPHQNDVLFLVVQYLQAKGFYTSSLALQQESGLDVAWLRGYSHEVALLRRWVFAGDVKRARSLLQPLTILTKLKCFECLVTLFRDPVGEDENNVFKYIAMPKLQLIALIHDAVLFHRQTGDETAQDCISMKCSVYEDDLVDKEDEIELLRLDEPFGQIPVEKYEIVPAKVANVTHSVEWMNLQRKQRNPLVSSVNFGRHQPQDTFKVREFEEEPLLETINVATSCDFDANETVDAAVSCDVEMIDTAVSCELDVKETADAAVSCEPEITKTVDAGVNCGPDEWTDAATQTENFQKINENEDECLLKDRECNGKVEEQHERHSNSSFGESIGHHFQPNDRFQPNREEHQSDHEQMNIATRFGGKYWSPL